MYESGFSGDNAQLARRVVALLDRPRAGLVTDIDGTISPIVARPEEAMVLPEARSALDGLRRKLALVGVVTGRSVADARKMVDLDGLTYIGNHGLEILVNGKAQLAPEARPWVPRIAQALNDITAQLAPSLKPGVIIENKGVTASLHYRLAPDPDRARDALLVILAAHEASSGIRLEEGRRVINLLPPLKITKGSAVSSMVREHDLEAIVFVGDDITDVHAFRALDRLRQGKRLSALSIGVVGPETPPSVRQLSDVSVPSVTAVADLLHAVLLGLGGHETSDTMKPRAPRVGSN